MKELATRVASAHIAEEGAPLCLRDRPLLYARSPMASLLQQGTPASNRYRWQGTRLSVATCSGPGFDVWSGPTSRLLFVLVMLPDVGRCCGAGARRAEV
jgi:hypothetical protein